MKTSLTAACALLALAPLVRAQCDHSVIGTDAFSDGWNGASLQVWVNGVPALGNFTVTGGETAAFFNAGTGDMIETIWSSGLFDFETEYRIFGGDGNMPPTACDLLAQEDGTQGTAPSGLIGIVGECSSIVVPCAVNPPIPINDDCANAIVLPGGPQTVGFDNQFASTDGTDLAGFCDPGPFGGDDVARDLWFRWTPATSGCHYITTLSLVSFDSRLAVYDGATCPDDPATVLACVDDEILPTVFPFEAGLDVELVAGQEILIRVGTFDESVLGGAGGLMIAVGAGAMNMPGDNPGAPGCSGPDAFPSACNGDGGDQLGCTDCPCMNNTSPGTIGGCLNSAGTSAQLQGSGSSSVTSVSPGDLQFVGVGMTPSSFCVLTSGNALAPQNMANPCFGTENGVQSSVLDGLRCAVQSTQRHGGRPVAADGTVGSTTNGWGGPFGPPVGIAGQGGFVAGQTRHFQGFYRELPGTSCLTEQNTTQAVMVVFEP